MLTIIIGNLVTVVAAAIGGFFALRAVSREHALVRAAQSERERDIAERVRTMLSLEIGENYTTFEKYDAGVNEQVLFQNGTHQSKERAQQLSETPLPTWKHHYWLQLTPSIPLALTPTEIQKCHEFYSSLDELTRLKNFSRTPQGTWHLCMEQSIAKLKHLKNPLHNGIIEQRH
jgi:hypothetical protein